MRQRMRRLRLRDATLLVALAWTPGARATIDGAEPVIMDLGAGAGLLQVTLNLLIVLAAIVVLAWLFKRIQGVSQPAAGALRVTASLPLGPKERLLLVDVGDEQILVGASGAGLNTLHVLSTPLTVSTDEAESPSFRERLGAALERGRT